MSTTTKLGNGLAKVFGIQLNYREYGNQRPPEDKLTRGESIFSISSADTYVESEPTILDWFDEHLPRPRDFGRYLLSLIPFISWLPRYNVQWLIGDLVAGMPRLSPRGTYRMNR